MVCRLGFYVIQTLLTFFPVRLFHLPTFLYFYKGVANKVYTKYPIKVCNKF